MGPAAQAVYAAVERAKARRNVVYQNALIRLAAAMQRPVTEGGNMPVKTGFLRSSFSASVSGYRPPLIPHPGGDHYVYDEAEVVRTLRMATIQKNRATLAYAAEYAVYVNHVYQFRDLAMQKFPQFVQEEAMKVKASG